MGNKTIIYTEKRNKFFSGDNANFDFNFDSEVKTDRELQIQKALIDSLYDSMVVNVPVQGEVYVHRRSPDGRN